MSSLQAKPYCVFSIWVFWPQLCVSAVEWPSTHLSLSDCGATFIVCYCLKLRFIKQLLDYGFSKNPTALEVIFFSLSSRMKPEIFQYQQRLSRLTVLERFSVSTHSASVCVNVLLFLPGVTVCVHLYHFWVSSLCPAVNLSTHISSHQSAVWVYFKKMVIWDALETKQCWKTSLFTLSALFLSRSLFRLANARGETGRRLQSFTSNGRKNTSSVGFIKLQKTQ